MASVDIGGMTWAEMTKLVDRKFNRLAMCKRGSVETDINKQLKALGPEPKYTNEECETIRATLYKKIQKAMTPTMTQVKRLKGDISAISNENSKKVRKMQENLYTHPDSAAWQLKKDRIYEQKEARLAALDADFQDVQDSFSLKLWDLDELPTKYVEMEQREW